MMCDIRRYKKNADKAIMDDFFDFFVFSWPLLIGAPLGAIFGLILIYNGIFSAL
jgi:hypothetical protein